MSRLTEMQTRFKQKQLQEKEDKLKKLLIHPDQQNSPIQSSKLVSERVRANSTITQQRYAVEERKQKAGIDRSYPLKPLKVNATITTRTTQATKVITSRGCLNNNIPLGRKSDFHDNFGCDDVNENRDISAANISRENSREIKRKELKPMQRPSEEDRTEVEVKPQMALKKPLKSTNGRLAAEKISSNSNPVPKPRTERPIPKASSAVSKVSPSPKTSPTARVSSRQIRDTKSPDVNDNLSACKNCGRCFLPDRLEVHEKICTKTAKKKRKTYDAVKHRVQGTDLEPFTKRPPKQSKSTLSKKTNWKQTHEEFINTIRAAKMAQAHLARGGKLSDLPPPPPSSNPDYVQCPNCGRRFNESAAARHIPKCANYSFNKSKAGPGVKVAGANKTRAMR